MKLKIAKIFFLLILVVLLPSESFSQQQDLSAKFWELEWIESKISQSGRKYGIKRKDWSTKIRKRLNSDADEYLGQLENEYAFYTDPELELYLQEQLKKVHAGEPHEKFRLNLQVKVMKSPEYNAFSMNNGTIVLTTGLFNTIRTEAELQAVLIHELSHIYLDHFVYNFRAQRRKATWGTILGVAGGIAAVTTAAALDKDNKLDIHDYELIGSLATDVSFLLSAAVLEALYLGHSKQQELQSDKLVEKALKRLKIPTQTYGNLLARHRTMNLEDGELDKWSMYSSHPKISKRIKRLGLLNQDYQEYDPDFDIEIMEVLSFNLDSYFREGKYSKSLALCERIRNTGYETAELLYTEAISKSSGAVSDEEKWNVVQLLDKAGQMSGRNLTPKIMHEKINTLYHMELYYQARYELDKMDKELQKYGEYDEDAESYREWMRKLQFKIHFKQKRHETEPVTSSVADTINRSDSVGNNRLGY
ncbi:hypothetical protein FUAX_49750 (plasmid) [Fulvitalea axinellae]|uniref:Peptidase M48 domain-containing protein n=1 Tax=Fulvitalea axinellae TaxID=1182444 RepID=A0AAU9CX73_9BACT|nr:hypothetical protein FUAX_49750 [Fulvitalea axinellae]